MVFCPNCYSNLTKKYGFDRKHVQKYRCRSCGRQFTPKTDTYFSGMRYPKNIINYALTLHYRHEKPLREVEGSLKNKGVEVSYVTIHGWDKKFAPFMRAMKFKPYTTTWHISEAPVNVNGEKLHLLTAYDSNGNILSVRLMTLRTDRQVELLMKDAIGMTGFKPVAVLGAQRETAPLVKEEV